MIKGLVSFIKSGALLNPMVLLGVVLGFVFYFSMDLEEIFALYKNYNFIIGIFVLSAAYNFFMKQVYKERSADLDLRVMSLNIIFSSLRFFVTNVFTMIFIYMVTF